MPETPIIRVRHTLALTPAEVRRVAAEAGVEPRTAAKYLRGERVVSTCAERIRRALAALGYEHAMGTP